MRTALRRAAAAAVIGLAGCSANGLLLVRGVVRADGPVRPEPLGGVTVQCRDGRDGVPGYARATTQEDGTYRIEHRYSGTWFPWVKPKGGDVYVEFLAPGYQRRLVSARGGDEPGVVRGESGPFTRLDVTLVPEAARPARDPTTGGGVRPRAPRGSPLGAQRPSARRSTRKASAYAAPPPVARTT